MNPLDQHLDQLAFLASNPAGPIRAQIELEGILPDSFKPNGGEPEPAVTVTIESDTYASGLSMLSFLHDNPGDLAALWMNEILSPEQRQEVRASPENSESFMESAAAIHEPYAVLSTPLSMTVKGVGLPEVAHGTTLTISAPSVRIGVNLFFELTTADRLSRLAQGLHSGAGSRGEAAGGVRTHESHE